MASKMDVSAAIGSKKKKNPSSDSVEYLLENDVIDIDTLKQFTIPKRKSHKQDVITRVEMMSPEMGELVRMVKQAYRHRDSSETFVYSRPRIVHNASLLNKFTNKKKRMRSDGYSDKELQETFVFLYYEEDYKACNACRDGVSIKNSSLCCLGDSEMGVYVSKYSDVLCARVLKNKTSGTLMILKLIKGRVKVMMDKSTVSLDPSPNYDCHVLKPPNNLEHASPTELFEATQIYVYEYKEDSHLATRPSQLLPYALLTFRYDKITRMSNISEPISSKYKKSVKRKSDRDSEQLQHKRHRHLIRKTITSGQQSIEAPHHSHPQQSHSHHNHPYIPPKEQQLWSGGFEVAGVSLGTVLLQSSCPLVDASLLKWELKVERQVTLSTLKEVMLDGLGRLDLRKETVSQDGLRVSCGLLHPCSKASEHFTSYIEHLLTHKMVGYTVLSGHIEVFITPVFFVRDYCLVSTDDAHRPMLCCLFVCKESIKSMVKEHLRNRVQLENAVSGGGKAAAAYLCTFTDAPASPEPEPEQPALNIRDPRIRFKTKSTKLNPNDPVVAKQGALDKCIIGSSRLMTLFENMATLQDNINNEVTNKPYGYKGDVGDGRKRLVGVERGEAGRPGGSSSMLARQPKMSKNDPRAKKMEPKASPSAEASQPVPAASPAVVEPSKPVIPDKPVEAKAEPEVAQNTKFVLPEIVYATAIADPKVRQLLEDLKNKNIIGFGSKPPSEATPSDENATKPESKPESVDVVQSEVEAVVEESPYDVSSSTMEPEYQSPSQEAHKVPVQLPIQPPPFASPSRIDDFQKDDGGFLQEGSRFSSYNDNFSYNNDYNMKQSGFPQATPRFRNELNSFSGRGRLFRPFIPRNRMMAPRDEQEPRRRFPSGLSDPNSFQTSFPDQPSQHQPPHHQQHEHQPIHQPPPHLQSQDHQPSHHIQPPHHHPPPQHQPRLPAPSQNQPHFNQPIRHPPPTHLQPPPHLQQPLPHHQQLPLHHQQPPLHHQQPLPRHHQPRMPHRNPSPHQQPYHQQQQQQHFLERGNPSNQQHTRFSSSNKLDPRLKRSRFSNIDSDNFAGNSSGSGNNENHSQNNSHHDYNRYNRT